MITVFSRITTIFKAVKATVLSLFLLSVFVFIHPSVFSQQPVNQGGYWITYSGDNKINAKWGIHSELQARNIGFANNTVQTLFLRTGIHYYTSASSMITAGYGYFSNSPNSSHEALNRTLEHRIWQQFISRKKTSNVFMEHRYRLEQRFMENRTDQTSKTDHRIRYRFQFIVPFYTISPYLRHFFFASFNEVMLNFEKQTDKIFDRNRLYGAIGYQVSPKLNFQLGYMHQLATQPMFATGEVNHLLQFTVSYNMDDLMRSFFIKQEPSN